MKLLSIHKICLVVIPGVLLSTASCKKFIEVDVPIDQVSADKAFLNDATALSSVLGLYANGNLLPASGSTENSLLGAATALGGAAADDIYLSSATYLDEFKTNTISTSSGYVNNTWNYAYAVIFAANSAIEGLNSSTGVSPAVKQQLLGETYFMRAFTYFYLTNLYGDVPKVTSTANSVNLTLPRAPQAEIYEMIISDLKIAQNNLADAYPSAQRARANKAAATALLSRVYLYIKDYANAEAQATTVINNSAYKLESLDSAFLNTSNEVIWQRFTFYGYSIFGRNFVPSGTTPNYVIYPSLAASFESDDQRMAKWLKPLPIGNITYYYPYKYKLRDATAGNEFNVLLRLAEQYLIRAEARAQLGKVTGAGSAAEDLNIVRTRAGLTGTTANTQSTMLLAIEKERAHELFAELGHRLFDLRRTGRADAVLGPQKPTWKSTAVLFPVPANQILYNKNLTQNQGYN
ncbi:RagB/SusD domain-containing protein [Chitinophaga ginsengisegetis]|uniref:RagB/SusD domain-containing protein n=1 Tax=Chitinophaga ginsengisegetis TaxID=393003 RepID=A0A1T5N5S9_9BACT|nr:RagB/SusD family nutrient uptake outer membrane protein [Chitinophaga ginsengisegetis]SKC95840.1 RagB/SusD domain-containing protein [Chitinophaga ginsengisegetis]